MTPSHSDLDHFSGDELNEIERRKLRKMIRDEERMTWFWATVRIWAGWAAAIGGALWFVGEKLADIARAIFR